MTWEQVKATYPTKSDEWVDGYVNGAADVRGGSVWIDPGGPTQDYKRGYRAGCGIVNTPTTLDNGASLIASEGRALAGRA